MTLSTPQSPPDAGPSEGELFKQTLGTEWQKLHPDIRRRFDKNPEPGKRLHYTGTLSELRCSLPGKLMGLLTRPIVGGALIPVSDTDVPVDIQVYSLPGDPAIYKYRLYRLNRHQPVEFTSHMLGGENGEVLEYVGAGLGMTLDLRVEDGNLLFTSGRYFWQIFGRRVPLPGLFTPGKTRLVHQNRGPDRFSIRIEIRHALFGLMFLQAGDFREITQASDVTRPTHSAKASA